MASSSGTLSSWSRTQKMSAVGAAVLAAALVVVAGIWGQSPDYRTLFAGVSDKDGGQIVAALDQLKIPYQQGDGGVFRVPGARVHEIRMKLASQGLPKSGAPGFELLDGMRLGASQFSEQVGYQRALEGELAKTVQSIASIQFARVHLAIPKQSVFTRDALQPSASVFVTLFPGRTLDRSQVAGIVNLVSSSVPMLTAKMVSVVDQDGEPLTHSKDVDDLGLSTDQLNLQRRIERDLTSEVEGILEPMLGRGNVRSRVRVDLDFSKSDETSETFRPNSGGGAQQSIRSTQTVRSGVQDASSSSGIPGAYSNTPPVNATAPMVAGASANAVPPPPAPAPLAAGGSDQAVTNYELDRTVKNIKGQGVLIKRVTVAVIVNDKETVDASGKKTTAPVAESEIAKIEKLTKQVVGFVEARGDVVSVAGAAFTQKPVDVIPEVPVWKDPEVLSIGKEVGKNIAFFVAAMLAFFGVIRPLVKRATAPNLASSGQSQEQSTAASSSSEGASSMRPVSSSDEEAANFERDLSDVRKFAMKDPAAAAGVIKNWTSGNE